ncbi:MAG: selenide, water dikinase SelD [Dehalococcoidales bacterium]|nr:selenide, water dikinase SelD [Dehalococcoidales bacterium]
MPFQTDPNLIAGMEHAEDAGIYKLRDDLAIVQTVDFFTPIVDDPYDFGRIAVANSLSDVYAMGGTPLTALNVVCFPNDSMDMTVLQEVLRGGLDAMHQANVILVGGHTVDDPELKYGLSVTGTIHPDRVVHNQGAQPGDKLILTKKLGTGIIGTAIKAGTASREAITEVIASMTALNKTASELMREAGVHACTDVTGFGLLGHAAEMIEGTDVGYLIHASTVPYFKEAGELAEQGMLPGGLGRNRDYHSHMVDVAESVPQIIKDVVYDPQTSGGLLIAVPVENAATLLKKLHEAGVADAVIIGAVSGENPGRIRVA